MMGNVGHVIAEIFCVVHLSQTCMLQMGQIGFVRNFGHFRFLLFNCLGRREAEGYFEGRVGEEGYCGSWRGRAESERVLTFGKMTGFVENLGGLRVAGVKARGGRWVCSAASRRDFMISLGGAVIGVGLGGGKDTKEAAATGLKLFPLTEPLANRYFFLRAGESVADAAGEIRTNPVEKLSVANGLTKKGEGQAFHAAEILEKNGFGNQEIWVWAGTEAKAQETAEILLFRMNLRRENLVPEYAYLDARGMGRFDKQPVHEVRAAIHPVDEINTAARMEPGEDGTPNESIDDVFVRMRQLISKTESQYQFCDIVFVAPDTYTLSVLECALRNEDLTKYTSHLYQPGEVRQIEPVITDPLQPRYLALDTEELVNPAASN